MKKLYTFIFTFLFLGILTTNAQYKDLYNFNSNVGAGGWGPSSTLTPYGGILYGMTPVGDLEPDLAGVIFSIDTNGSAYNVVLEFDSAATIADPYGALILSGNVFYGMTIGSDSGNGSIFSIHTDGTHLKVLYYFPWAAPYGGYPWGSLIISGSKLYGMSQGGEGNGNIFSIDTNGNNYKDLLDFTGKNGWDPWGNLTLVGGVLYGTTLEGGASCVVNSSGGWGYGNIFSIDTNGNGYKDLFDFDEHNGFPSDNLLYSNGHLYGSTEFGGIDSDGYIFSIDTNGSGFRDLFDFKGTNGEGGLSVLSGHKFYGISGGGIYNKGIIFSIDTNGKNYKQMFAFNGVDGNGPTGLILFGKKLFGMTGDGGLDSSGVIFSLDTSAGCSNNYNQTICIVTIDTAINKNVIIWGRNDSPPDGYFNIYDSTSLGWRLIGSVSDTAFSEFIDTLSNPDLQSYSYRISTVDSCGESALSPFNSTIYLQVLQESSGRDSLYWTPYVGFTTPYYLIYRGPSLNALTLIDSVTGSIQSFVDTLPPAGSIYLIEAINPSGGCTPTKRFTHGSSTNTYASISNGGVPKKVTGIGNITYPKNAVTISPNPNNGKFTFQSLAISRQSLVQVYNMLGEMIYTTKLNSVNTLVDLSNNSNGVYLYRVISANGNLVSEGKFIKE